MGILQKLGPVLQKLALVLQALGPTVAMRGPNYYYRLCWLNIVTERTHLEGMPWLSTAVQSSCLDFHDGDDLGWEGKIGDPFSLDAVGGEG